MNAIDNMIRTLSLLPKDRDVEGFIEILRGAQEIGEKFLKKDCTGEWLKNKLQEKKKLTRLLRDSEKNMHDKPKVVKDDWTYLFRETETGWSLTCTLLYDPAISSCNRVTISIDKKGKISISKPKHVHRSGGYI